MEYSIMKSVKNSKVENESVLKKLLGSIFIRILPLCVQKIKFLCSLTGIYKEMFIGPELLTNLHLSDNLH